MLCEHRNFHVESILQINYWFLSVFFYSCPFTKQWVVGFDLTLTIKVGISKMQFNRLQPICGYFFRCNFAKRILKPDVNPLWVATNTGQCSIVWYSSTSFTVLKSLPTPILNHQIEWGTHFNRINNSYYIWACMT